MDSTPAKRRKTSPTTSVPIDAPTTPSRIPVRVDALKTTPGRRPSFASPTKASISRHNPQLLARPSSSGDGAVRPGSRGRNLDEVFARALKDVRPSVERQENMGDEGTEGSTTQENEMQDENALRSQTPRSIRSVGGGLSARPRRISRSPFKQAPKPSIPTDELQENINPFKRTGLRRSPIASQEEPVLQENMNPFEKKGLRRSPVSSQPLITLRQGSVPPEVSTTPTEEFHPPAVDAAFRKDPTSIDDVENPHAEEEMPMISQVQDPITITRQSPTRDPAVNSPVRNKQPLPAPAQVRLSRNAPTLSEEPKLPPTPVELGIPDPVVTTPPLGIHDTPSKRARRNKALGNKIKSSPLKPRDARPEPEKVLKPPETQPPIIEPLKSDQRRRSARFITPIDPYAAKKKQRDDNLKLLEQLQADVALARKENERLRLHSDIKRSPPSAPKNHEDLQAMLLRATVPETVAPRLKKPVSISNSINSFLPFASRRRPKQIIPSLDKPIPSHLPVAVDNPLPYLQAFSPLTYTSTITLLPSEAVSPNTSTHDTEPPVIQRHLINASHPSGLFNALLAMTVDSSMLSINALDILKLDPAAEKELGPFVRQRSGGDSTLNRDIGVICWAMGRWVETSILRARFWCAVDSEFGTAEARAKSLQQRKKRKIQKVVAEDDSLQPLDTSGEDVGSKKQTWSRRRLLTHMGRTAMELASDDVELRFEWKIGIDWTGEVESTISAFSKVPKHWQQADSRKGLSKVPESFNRLVERKGPLNAVRTIVGLLMSE